MRCRESSEAVGFPGASALGPMADIGAQGLELLARRALGRALDLPIAFDQRQAEWRQHRAPTVLTAGLPFDRSAPANTIDLIDEIPCTLVRHVHRPPGCGDRAAAIDIFKQ